VIRIKRLAFKRFGNSLAAGLGVRYHCLNMKAHGGPIAIAHRVLPHEGFDRTAQILLILLNRAQRQFPDVARVLHLEIDGHKNSKGEFDRDMFELQTKFMTEFLIQFLTRVEMPVGILKNPGSQKNTIPETLSLIQVDRPSSGER
jgi:hypothetical protein